MKIGDPTKIQGPGPTTPVKRADAVARPAGAPTGAAVGLRTPVDMAQVLGIPEAEFTPKVRDAIMRLMSEVDKLRREAAQANARSAHLERLADRLDDQRHVICFGSPAWLDADSRDMLSGPLARLAEPLAGFFGPGVAAAALSLHFGATGYAELMAVR
jgi:hypothetical protein